MTEAISLDPAIGRKAPESAQQLWLAAEARWREGNLPLDANYRTGAHYLFGYVAECFVKGLCLVEYSEKLAEVEPGFGAIKVRKGAAVDAYGIPWENDWHDVRFFARFYLCLRTDKSFGQLRTLLQSGPGVGNLRRLISAASFVHAHWHPSLRYQTSVPFEDEVTGMSDAITILRDESGRVPPCSSRTISIFKLSIQTIHPLPPPLLSPTRRANRALDQNASQQSRRTDRYDRHSACL